MTPLSISLPTSTANTTVPLIAEGQFAKWQFVSLKEDKNDTGPFLTFTCKLAAPTVTTDGTPLTPESPVGNVYWHKIYLYEKVSKDSKEPKRGPDGAITVPERSLIAVSSFIDALLNTCDANNANAIAKGKTPRPNFDDATVQAMTNQFFYAKMRVKNDEGYGLRNEFGTLLNEADMPKAT